LLFGKKTTPTQSPAAKEKNMSSTAQLILDNPIQRGDQQISSITLHKPKGGTLKGISIRAIMDMECDTIQRLLPRISDPKLTAAEANNMEAEDIAMAGMRIAVFFLPKASEEEVTALLSQTE
jgi:hypothetical protein